MTDTCMRVAKDTFNKAPEGTRNGEIPQHGKKKRISKGKEAS